VLVDPPRRLDAGVRLRVDVLEGERVQRGQGDHPAGAGGQPPRSPSEQGDEAERRRDGEERRDGHEVAPHVREARRDPAEHGEHERQQHQPAGDEAERQ
jgi:hypothetical protein